MAGIVEFGQRQKQKKETDITPAFESEIDHYLEEMEEKEELLSLAREWELKHGGMSGRCAEQFINYILGFSTQSRGQIFCISDFRCLKQFPNPFSLHPIPWRQPDIAFFIKSRQISGFR